ncbi:MAG: hypothetical protein RML72_00745 [Bacteroidia bacterium]|nr:hypothetical protein [Bacteroidia bacterium]MDW8157393.1 hypothetical protein [Bacteroidia bacterium]
MYRVVFKCCLLVGILVAELKAQPTLDSTFFAQLAPRSIGPAVMSGRVAAIVVDPNNHNLIYVGAATGGVWKSTNRGVSWQPIFDALPTSSIGALALDPNNPEVLWVGTGEANTRNSAGVGRGVYKTLDGGKTWRFLGLEKTEHIARIIIHPHNPDIAWVAALGTTWGENPERGVFKTTDGGKTWKKVLYVDERTGAADLAIHPANPNRLIASMWEHRRWPWFFKSGGKGSGIYCSYDGGETWKKLTTKDGLPEGELGRAGIAYARSNPNVVYMLLEAKESALLRSEDGGQTWKTVNKSVGVNPRPFYFCDIRVHPLDENKVYRLQVTLDVSIDGGKTFTPLIPYSLIHPDHQALWIDPHQGLFMVDGNDGGVAISENGGKTWEFVRNLPLGQFYHIATDNQYPYNVYGGLQDNGSWRGPSNSLAGEGVYNEQWELVSFGDGFGTLPDPKDPDFGYAMWQGGNLVYWHYPTGRSKYIRPKEEGVKLRFNWNAAIAIDPLDPNTVYYGSQFVHKTTDKGQTWTIISPDLTTNDTSKQKQALSGGLTRDVTTAENYTTILTIAPSPVQKGVIWVGTDDGNIQVTKDGGNTWELVSKNLVNMKGGPPTGTWIPCIEASHFDPATAYVVLDDHRRANWTPYVYVTRDYGKTWQSLVTKEIDGFTHVIRQDFVDKNLLFLGTEFGLYVSFNEGKNWIKWKAGFPTVPVHDMVIHQREHDLIIGTHGRGIYILDDIRPLRNLQEVLQKKLWLFPVGIAYQYAVRGENGKDYFAGEHIYKGQKRPYGALLSIWVNAPDSILKKAEGPNSPKVKIEILDKDSTTIRTLYAPIRAGIVRTNWDLRLKALRLTKGDEEQPLKEKETSDPPGIEVLSGVYYARLSWDKHQVIQPIEVRTDPRMNFSLQRLQSKHNWEKKAEKLALLLDSCYYQLEKTTKTINMILQYSSELDTTVAAVKTLRDSAIAYTKKIKQLQEKIKPDYKNRSGYWDDSEYIRTIIGDVLFQLSTQYEGPTDATLAQYQKAFTRTQQLFNDVNKFYEQEMERIKEWVQKAGINFWGQYSKFELK